MKSSRWTNYSDSNSDLVQNPDREFLNPDPNDAYMAALFLAEVWDLWSLLLIYKALCQFLSQLPIITRCFSSCDVRHLAQVCNDGGLGENKQNVMICAMCFASPIKWFQAAYAVIWTDIQANIQADIWESFNKFQDWHPYTTTVSPTFLTVMLLFNIFSLQFTAVFPLFYKSAGTRSIKFLLAPCWNFQMHAVEHLHCF